MLVWHGINNKYKYKDLVYQRKIKIFLICNNRVCNIYAQLSIPTSFACSSIRAIIRALHCLLYIDGLTVPVYDNCHCAVGTLSEFVPYTTTV